MKKQEFPEALVPLVTETNNSLQLFFSNKKRINVLIKSLYKNYGKHIKRFLNYDVIAEAFNQEFFLKNYAKALLLFNLLHESGYELGSELFDVGCGAAPGGIAFSKYAHLIGYDHTQIVILDKSRIQLDLAKKFCLQNQVPVDRSLKQMFQIEEKEYQSVVLFSYFICEQGRRFIKDLYKYSSFFKKGFVAIDYQHNIERIERVFRNNGCYRIHSFYYSYLVPETLRPIFQEKDLFVNGCYFEPKNS